MYNAEFKERYLAETNVDENSKKGMLREFEHVAFYEEMLGKDAANFTLSEIITYYKLKGSPSIQTLSVINSYYTTYTRFALLNNFVDDGINHYGEVDTTILRSCMNMSVQEKQIVTKEELIQILQSYPFAYYEQFILISAFEGIRGFGFSDVINIKPSDINGNCLKLASGREITVSSEYVTIANYAANEYEYTITPVSGHERIRRFNDNDECCIKTPTRKDVSDISITKKRMIQKALKRMTDATGLAFTYNSLMDSGLIHYIKTLQNPGEEPMDCIVRNVEAIENKYGPMKNRSRFLIQYGDCF